MTMNEKPTTAPAERTRPGTAVQRVNLHGPDGTFIRQVRHYGTEAQARAYARLQITHDTDPDFQTLQDAYRAAS